MYFPFSRGFYYTYTYRPVEMDIPLAIEGEYYPLYSPPPKYRLYAAPIPGIPVRNRIPVPGMVYDTRLWVIESSLGIDARSETTHPTQHTLAKFGMCPLFFGCWSLGMWPDNTRKTRSTPPLPH